MRGEITFTPFARSDIVRYGFVPSNHVPPVSRFPCLSISVLALSMCLLFVIRTLTLYAHDDTRFLAALLRAVRYRTALNDAADGLYGLGVIWLPLREGGLVRVAP